MEIVIILLIAIFCILIYIASILQHWLYRIAKNQKVAFEEIYEKMKGGENVD